MTDGQTDKVQSAMWPLEEGCTGAYLLGVLCLRGKMHEVNLGAFITHKVG